jgi:Ca-activated chloride channel family protein
MKNKLRMLLMFAPLAFAAQVHADTLWSNLWRNPDPRGKSYAEFKAGNYAAAAQDLAPFDDSEANYNRGNALAFAGDLQGALKAYDAALKQDPNNRDAQHNRALVANALKQQPQQPPQQPKQDSKPDQKQDAKNGQQKDQQAQNGQSGNQPGDQKNNQNNSDQSGNQSNKPGQKNDAKPDANASANPPPQNGQSGQSGQAANQQPPNDAKNDADQARRDVAAGAANPSDAGANANAAVPRTPQAEQQIAQDQWLRSIPDDPGGLLRRKFLIEHMIRQQSAQP